MSLRERHEVYSFDLKDLRFVEFPKRLPERVALSEVGICDHARVVETRTKCLLEDTRGNVLFRLVTDFVGNARFVPPPGVLVSFVLIVVAGILVIAPFLLEV